MALKIRLLLRLTWMCVTQHCINDSTHKHGYAGQIVLLLWFCLPNPLCWLTSLFDLIRDTVLPFSLFWEADCYWSDHVICSQPSLSLALSSRTPKTSHVLSQPYSSCTLPYLNASLLALNVPIGCVMYICSLFHTIYCTIHVDGREEACVIQPQDFPSLEKGTIPRTVKFKAGICLENLNSVTALCQKSRQGLDVFAE